MKNRPLVSVIVPVYKAENYLSRCIISILDQTYSQLEIILVDDGSPDKCPRICDNFAALDTRIKVIHKVNGGISSAMNAGLDCMTGEYVTFIDSDDFICKSYVRDMLCMCIKYHCDMAACSPYYGCGNDFHGICEKERIWAYDRVSAFMSRKITSSVVGKLYKAELYATERFPVSDHYNYEDEALIYKLLYQSDHVAVTDRKMYYCYQSPETTARNDRNYMEDDFFEVLENRICYFADKEEELYDLSWEYYGVCMVLAYMKSKRDKLNHNDREEFIQIYKRAFKMINRNRITPISLKLMLSAFYVAPDLSTSIANMFHLRLLLATWDHFLNDRKWVAYLFLLI